MDDRECAEKLDRCADQLINIARVYRGEAEDLTSYGAWNIFCAWLEDAMNVKVITKEQWDSFIANNQKDQHDQ